MFATVKAEAADRLFSLEIFFRAACGLGDSRVSLIARGLAFVQMYAAYEYSLVNSVKAAILEIKAKHMPINTVRLELLSLLLIADFKSAEMCGLERIWPQRISLLQRTNSSTEVDTAESEFPIDGNHFNSLLNKACF